MYSLKEHEKKIVSIILNEKNAWEEGEVFITDKVAYLMKQVVKKARKNYFGVFTNPKDPMTGRDKLFVPYTEWMVETVVKNIDIDTKDIVVKAKNGHYIEESVFRYVLKHFLDKIRFGQTINELIRDVAIDGTGILKAEKVTDKKGKKSVDISIVDRLNILVDPSAKSIDESPSIIQRNILTVPEFQHQAKHLNFNNIEDASEQTTFDRTGFDRINTRTQSEVPYVETFSRYGYLPKSCITGNEEDTEYVYALAIVSGLEDNPVVHSVKEVDSHPYGAFRFKKVKNRFDGRGIGEMLFDSQAYVNETVNIRLNTNRVNQTGLWEIRGNITPQQLKKLFENHAIKTNNEGDISKLQTGSIDSTSYTDEQTAYSWGQRQAQAQREDEVAVSKPATNALIEERGASKAYELVMEGILLDLSEFLEEKVTPLLQECYKDGDIVNITGDPSDLQRMQEPFVRNHIIQKIIEFKDQNGYVPVTSEDIDAQVEAVSAELAKMGTMRPVEYAKKAFDTEFAVNIEPREERINTSVMANQMVQVIGMLASSGMDVREPTKELFSLMGLDSDKLTRDLGAPQKNADMQAKPQQQEMVPKPVENIPNAQGI